MTHLLNEMSGLIAFVRTVEVGSFSAAARDLKTSPSAISKSVGRLEKLVGSRLFLRSTRALTLTPDGQMLFERIGPLLRAIDDLHSMPFARYSVGSRTAHIAFADGSKILPTGRIDCDSGIALHSAARHGLGVALLLRCVVADDLDSGILIDVTPAGALKPMRFSAVHALGRTVPSRVKLLSDFVSLEAQKLSIRARSPGDAAAARD